MVLALLANAPEKKRRIVVDPGHGYAGNEGARSVRCEKEQDVVLELARDLAARLNAGGKLDVRLSRTSSIGAAYRDRIAAAERAGAELILSLHLDARGEPGDFGGCPRNDAEQGLAILYSDRG